MLQNARVIVFTVSELLMENQQGEGVKITLSSPRCRNETLRAKKAQSYQNQDNLARFKIKIKYFELM